MSKTAVNIRVRIICELRFYFSEIKKMPISSIAGSYDGCMFSYFKTCQTAFQSDSTILHPHQQWMNDPVSSQACQHLIEIILNLYINLGKTEIFAMMFFNP